MKYVQRGPRHLAYPLWTAWPSLNFRAGVNGLKRGSQSRTPCPKNPVDMSNKVVISMTPEFYVRTFEHHAGTFNRVEVAAGTWMGRAHVNDPRQGGEVATCHCDRGIIEGRGSWEGLPLLSSVDRFHSNVCPDHNIVKVANSLSILLADLPDTSRYGSGNPIRRHSPRHVQEVVHRCAS